MFKLGSFEAELKTAMEKNLISNQVDNQHGFSKLAKAADYLNIAANIFEKAGMTEEAAEITNVLIGLSKKLSK